MPCQCAYCLNMQWFVWESKGKLLPNETAYFRYPMYVRIKIAGTNTVAILEDTDKIRFDDGKVKWSWSEATKEAYRRLGKKPSRHNTSIDQWLPNSVDPMSMWTIRVMGVGSISLDLLDIASRFVSNGPKLECSSVTCVDTTETVNYELASNPLFAHSRALSMLKRPVRADIIKARDASSATTTLAEPPARGGESAKRKKTAHDGGLQNMDTRRDEVEEDEELPTFNWSIQAPVNEWNNINVARYIERHRFVPILSGIDRTFKKFGVNVEFMNVRMLHPLTNEEVKLTLSSALLYHVAAYKNDVARELQTFRSMP